MKFHFCTLLLITFFSSSLLASPSDQNEKQDVYVYRPSSFSSWGRVIIVNVNGIPSTELASCTFAKLKLPSGIYRFDAALKPWPFDPSTGAASIIVSIASDGPTYIGYYPNELSTTELSATFISYPNVSIGRLRHYFGVTHPEVASKEMVSCSAVKSLHD